MGKEVANMLRAYLVFFPALLTVPSLIVAQDSTAARSQAELAREADSVRRVYPDSRTRSDSLAQRAGEREQANLAHEMTECAAYLTILSQIPGNSEALKNTYLGMADTVGRHAIYLTGDGEVYAARSQLAAQRMVDEEMREWDRVAVLNAKYGPSCAAYVRALRDGS